MCIMRYRRTRYQKADRLAKVETGKPGDTLSDVKAEALVNTLSYIEAVVMTKTGGERLKDVETKTQKHTGRHGG